MPTRRETVDFRDRALREWLSLDKRLISVYIGGRNL